MEVGATVLIAGIGFMSIILLLTIVLLIWYSGYLDNVKVGAGEPPCGALNVMYKFGTGPYKDVGGVFTIVTALAPQKKCFGVYYDDPKQVWSKQLRWAVGCVLSEGPEDFDDSVVKAFEGEGFKRYRFPAVSNAVTTSFPYRSQLSVLIGMYRAYPEMVHYIRKMRLCAHPFIELYAGDRIHCYAPLSKQECFYVPETSPHYVDARLVTTNLQSTTPPLPAHMVADPGEGPSGLNVIEKQASVEAESTVKVSSEGIAQRNVIEKEGSDDGLNPVELSGATRESAQRVPDMTELVKQRSDGTDITQDRIVPDASLMQLTPKRGSKSMSKASAKSESAIQSQTTGATKSASSRAKSEMLSVAKTEKDFMVQDSGVTSTMAESGNPSDSEDSYTEFMDQSPMTSVSIFSESSYVSSDHSYSNSEQSMFSDITEPSQHDSDMTEPSQTSRLVELSSDSEGDTSLKTSQA